MITNTEIVFLIILCLIIGSLIYLLLTKPSPHNTSLKDKIAYYLLLYSFIVGTIVLLIYYLLYVLLLKKTKNKKKHKENK